MSDTHIPRAAHELPPEIIDEIGRSDMILHAGDFTDEELFDKISKMDKPLHAVCGNMDTSGLRRRLTDKKVFNVGKFKFGLIHGYGAPKDLMQTVRGEFGDVDVIVFGHSHSAVNMKKDGVLFFNPGSPTDIVFAKERSYGIIEITDKLVEGTIVRLQ